MHVQEWMSHHPYAVQQEETITHATGIMKEHRIRHLPVLDGDTLVGILTDRDLKEFTPSRATALEIHELHYLLATAKVREAMRRHPLTAHPEDPLEDAARLMHDARVGCLPVVTRGGKLCGILTQEDLFEALVTVTGGRSEGTRIQLTVDDTTEAVCSVLEAVRASPARLISLLTTRKETEEGRMTVVLRVVDKAQRLQQSLRERWPDIEA